MVDKKVEKDIDDQAVEQLQQRWGESREEYKKRMASAAAEAEQAQKEGRKTGTIWDYFGGSRSGQKKGQGWEHVAQGTPAKHKRGVLYEGNWEVEAHGICEHVRRNARALAQAGVPVHLQTSRMGYNPSVKGEDKALREQFTALLQPSFGSRAVQIHHLEPVEGALPLVVTHQWLPKETLAHLNKRRIFFCVWERNGLSDEDVAALKQVGMVWTATHRNASMLHAAGVERVEVVPVPHWPEDPLLQLYKQPRRRGPPRFYHIGKWEPRKEQHRIIGAFLLAFAPGEAHLYLKTTVFGPKAEGYPSSYNYSIDEWLKEPALSAKGWTLEVVRRNIFIIEEDMPRSQMVKLHGIGDIYVTLSHGEGWDLPAYDAKLAGNLMVYTPSGGPEMFAGPEDYRVPCKTEEIPCHPFYRWKGTWIDYDLEDASVAMRTARDAWRLGYRKAVQLRLREYSAANVGQQMRAYIEELIDSDDQVEW